MGSLTVLKSFFGQGSHEPQLYLCSFCSGKLQIYAKVSMGVTDGLGEASEPLPGQDRPGQGLNSSGLCAKPLQMYEK